MVARTKDPTRALERQQRQHARLLARVEKTTAQLERRTAKLHAVEARLAELQQRVANPRARSPRRRASDRDVQLVFNPMSGRDSSNNAMRLAHVVSALRAHRLEPGIGVRTPETSARDLARRAKADAVGLVIVAGGDGTIEDVAGELVGTGIALGIVPLGTMNNIARSLGVPLDIDEACALIAMGARRHIDVGRVSTLGEPHADHFLECAGLGLSAFAAFAGEGLEKHRWHLLPRIVQKFFESKPGAVQIGVDDVILEAHTRIVTVSNAPLSGNNMLVAPGAKMDDGLLDVVVYDGMGDAALMKHFVAAGNHGAERLPTHRARTIRITTQEPLPINSDTEVMAKRRSLRIDVVPGSLTVIAGNGIGLTVPVEATPGGITSEPPPAAVDGTAPNETIGETQSG